MDLRSLGLSPVGITVISASHLQNVNLFMKMDVYVVISMISKGTILQQQTHVSKSDSDHRWNHTFTPIIHASAIQSSIIQFTVYSKRVLGDKIIGQVRSEFVISLY